MNTIGAHCVPMALVVMDACVFWLQDTFRPEAASVDVAMTQLLGINQVERGMPAIGIGSPEMGIPRKVVRGVINRCSTTANTPGFRRCNRYTRHSTQTKGNCCEWVSVSRKNTGRRWTRDTTTSIDVRRRTDIFINSCEAHIDVLAVSHEASSEAQMTRF